MVEISRRPGARELARRAMKAQVSEMAFELFVERGYEETSVEDICAVAGISRSTFFRYFPAKEDVLMGEGENTADRVLAALRERPDAESAWTALRHAMIPAIEHYGGESDKRLKLLRLISATPVLAAHQKSEKAPVWSRVLGPELARRLGADEADETDPRPAALVTAALGCLDAALLAWAASEGRRELTVVLNQSLDAVGA